MLKPLLNKIIKNPYLSILMIFSVALIYINYVWITKDIAPPPWDQAWYLENSEIMYQSWFQDGIIGFFKSYAHALNGAKAPLISVLPLPLYLLFGDSELVSLGVNFIFLILMSYFLFKLVSLLKNEKAAFISVLIVQTFPFFIGLSRQVFTEYGLATLVVIFLYFLVKSDHFKDKKANTALGVLLGLGLLMKILFLLYITFPVLWYVYLRYKGKKDVFKKPFLMQVFKMAVIGVLIAATWYGPNLKNVVGFALSAAGGDIAANYGSIDVFNWSVLSEYYHRVIRLGLTQYHLWLFVAGFFIQIFVLLFKKQNRKEGAGLLILWFAIPFLVLSFGVNKDSRYMLPILPVLGILVGLAFANLIEIIKKRQTALVIFASIILVIYPVYNIYDDSFVDKTIAPSFKGMYPPDTKDWKGEEIVEYIYKEMYQFDNPSQWNLIALEHPSVNYNTYSYIARSKHYQLPIGFVNLGFTQNNFESVISRFPSLKPNFVLVEEGIPENQLPEWANLANDEVRSMMESGELPYTIDKSWHLDHGPTLTLFRRKD